MIKEDKNKKRVLVVDDEPDIRELVQHHLEIEGFEVLSAPDGEKGLFLIQNELPDLIILDLMLPGIDGLEVCRKLNNIESTSGDINIDPAGSGDINITGDVNILGILTATVIQ